MPAPDPGLPLIGILAYSFLAFTLGVFFTPWFVAFLRRNRLGKQLRVEAVDGGDVPVFRKYHQHKFGTPTMGGLLIWGTILLTVLLSRFFALLGWVDYSLLQRSQVYLPLFTLVALGALGALDDYLNIIGFGRKKGLDWLPKLLILLLISGAGAWWFYTKLEYDDILIPFLGVVNVGFLYVPIFMFILVATANSVNITDGLDGLAGGLLLIAFGAFGVIAYLNGLTALAGFCGVCVGAIAAFLWYNVPPALFIMGDTGSLAMGGTLGVIALMTDNVLTLPLVGAIFVVEMLSVIIQLLSKRFRHGKRVFKAAPIHHHFEALDWGESKVTMRFWIIGAFCAFLGIIVAFAGRM
ncbi:MAG TPA: phospho-N-acetylmuramoyl-pentapeptide-transferase [Candidatus Peribacteraceae bacterium]|nr:phospho-N-acetylmuramoyl-pentapeptide-transferase [Candidatus Peribacteraceae bacterium]